MFYVVYVQDRKGDIVWEMDYPCFNGMVEDLRNLEKPSMFGNENFRIVINRENASPGEIRPENR